jgi:hypothetical protein
MVEEAMAQAKLVDAVLWKVKKTSVGPIVYNTDAGHVSWKRQFDGFVACWNEEYQQYLQSRNILEREIYVQSVLFGKQRDEWEEFQKELKLRRVIAGWHNLGPMDQMARRSMIAKLQRVKEDRFELGFTEDVLRGIARIEQRLAPANRAREVVINAGDIISFYDAVLRVARKMEAATVFFEDEVARLKRAAMRSYVSVDLAFENIVTLIRRNGECKRPLEDRAALLRTRYNTLRNALTRHRTPSQDREVVPAVSEDLYLY